MNGTERVALVHAPAAQVAPYLPANYQVAEEDVSTNTCIIAGHDNCGWTLEAYVIPRLASGLIHAEEILTEEPPPSPGGTGL
jgi:hypothetical protein